MVDEFHARYPNRECYICHRTEEDLKVFQEQLTSGIKQRIEDLENEMQAAEDNILQILNNTYPTDLLDFKVTTVHSDLQKFKKMIPFLDELLKFKADGKDRGSRQETLMDIRERLKNRPKGEWTDKQMAYKQKALDELKVAKKSYEDGNFWRFSLYSTILDLVKITGHNLYEDKKSIITSNLEMKSQVSFFICSICHGLLEQASRAAHNVLDDYDDDDW